MRELTSGELVGEMLAMFGATTTARLLGWCVLTGVRIPADAELNEAALIRYGWGAKSTRYRNVAHLKEFKARLAARGFTIGADVETQPAQLLAAVAA